jgi:uncharacterized damage-inducible protein DinB
MERPDPSEYFEYYGRYVDLVPDGDIMAILEDEVGKTLDVLSRVPADREDYAYAEGKWSIKEVMGHVIDTERCFGYRAMHFSRNDPSPLPSFEQDDIARESNAAERRLKDLADEFERVRRSHIALFKSFDEEMSMRRGVASGCEFTVRCIPYIIAGHEIHHRGVLVERYL